MYTYTQLINGCAMLWWQGTTEYCFVRCGPYFHHFDMVLYPRSFTVRMFPLYMCDLMQYCCGLDYQSNGNGKTSHSNFNFFLAAVRVLLLCSNVTFEILSGLKLFIYHSN